MNKICSICGDDSKNKYFYTTPCNHEAHYECFIKSFKSSKDNNNLCPFCRSECGLLPIINGLKNLEFGIHYNLIEDKIELNNINCQYIFKKGKNKGEKCNKNSVLGFNLCSKHI